MLDRFMTEWLVGPRLSRARLVLWDAITEVIGEEKTEAIAESTPRFPDPVPDEVRSYARTGDGGTRRSLASHDHAPSRLHTSRARTRNSRTRATESLRNVAAGSRCLVDRGSRRCRGEAMHGDYRVYLGLDVGMDGHHAVA